MRQLVSVRPLEPDDHDAWRRLWDGYNALYGRSGETALPEAITRLLWERLFDPAEPVHARVAELDGRVVGLVHYLFHRSTTMDGPICYLNDLFTSAEARGAGVGRALIEAVYEAARAAGSTRVYWQTHETNRTAMRLYDQVAAKSGFIVYRKEL